MEVQVEGEDVEEEEVGAGFSTRAARSRGSVWKARREALRS